MDKSLSFTDFLFRAKIIHFVFSSMHSIRACALSVLAVHVFLNRKKCVSSEDSLPKVCSGTLVQVQGRRDFIEEEFTKVKLHQVLK